MQRHSRLNWRLTQGNPLCDGAPKAETVIGERGTLEVLISEENFVNAQASLLTARRNAFIAALQVLASTGGLTAEGLHLPVHLYDPSVHYREDAGRPLGLGDTSDADRRATIEEGVSSKPIDISSAPIDVNRLLDDGIAIPSANGRRIVPKSKAK